MHNLYGLKEKLVQELEAYKDVGSITTSNLDAIDKLAHATKNLCKVIEACEDEEYSEDGGSYYSERTYARDGGSSRRGGSSRGYDSEGSYRRGRSRTTGRYMSRADGMADELRELMNNAPTEETRAALREVVRRMEQM